MAVIDDIKEQQKKLADMTTKEKTGYILYYYKLHILVVLVVIIFIAALISDITSNKESALNAAFINSNVYDASLTTMEKDFAAYSGIDTKKYDILLDYGMTINYDATDQMTYGYAQKMTAELNSGIVDVIIADKPIIENYASIAAFKNLDETLPAELLEKLDKAGFKFYYYTYEEDGKIPIGLYIKDSKILQEAYNDGSVKGVYASSVPPIFTIAITSKNVDNAISFLEYLLSENNL